MNAILVNEVARIAAQLADMCGDDAELYRDMLEGETDLFRIVGKLHASLASDRELLAGIAERAADLDARKKRIAARSDNTKAAIGAFLRAASLPNIELAEATYSVRDGKAKIEVIDAEAVPLELCRMVTAPDKAKINAAYADAEELPNWLNRTPARDVVTARTK